MIRLITLLFLITNFNAFAQDELKVEYFPIGEKSNPEESNIQLELEKRFQHYKSPTNNANDIYDTKIQSPKSVNILEDKDKFYVQNLEGYSTSVYSLSTFEFIKSIKHKFNQSNAYLFQDTTIFNYKFNTKSSNWNVFQGKPVESCLSHNGKYLWVTYYRRSFDKNAIDPSAVAIIDTDTDSIIRVMPTGALPKMIACSPDNKYIAVTHWGDNTVGLIDISGNNVDDFKYIKHFIVGKQLNLDYDNDKKIDRDSGCGYCLRGTVFSPDSKYLLVGRMGGGGIAIFNIPERKYLKTLWGMQYNLRHLEINNDQLYIGTNVTGYVQRTHIDSIIQYAINANDNKYTNWESCYVGKGVRTIKISDDGNYVFAAVNNLNKIAVVQTSDMKKIAEIGADSFPVGMDLSWKTKTLIVTSQGKYKYGGGHSVMVFKISEN